MPAEVMPWAIIWNMAPVTPQSQYCEPATGQTAMPRTT